MRVGVYLGSASPRVGGGFVFELSVLRALAKCVPAGQELVVFGQPASIPELPTGIPYVCLRRARAARVAQGAISTLRALARQCRHPAGPWYRQEWGTQLLARHGIDLLANLGPLALSLELPYLVTYFDLQHRLQPWFPEVSANGEWAIREARYQALFRRAAVIVAGSVAGKQEIEQFYQVPGDRIAVLPLPTPDFALQPPGAAPEQVLARWQLPEHFLFYPAQFWPHKNHTGLLLALRELRQTRRLPIELVLTGGDQGNLGHVRQLARELGLAQQVHCLGFVSQAELVALYQKALALADITFFGPSNLPPLEAFGLGCPVIASDLPGASEQLGDAALLVDPRQPSAIAEAVQRLYDTPALAQTLRDRGRQRAGSWTTHDYARQLWQVLETLGPLRQCWPIHPQRTPP